MQAQDTATTGRIQRGMAFYRERAEEIVQNEAHEHVYTVPASSRALPYTVDLEESYCSCPDNQHREAFCKHLIAATIADTKRQVEEARRLSAKRHDPLRGAALGHGGLDRMAARVGA